MASELGLSTKWVAEVMLTPLGWCQVTALGPVMELRRTWFAEAGVEEVTRAAAQAAKRELEG